MKNISKECRLTKCPNDCMVILLDIYKSVIKTPNKNPVIDIIPKTRSIIELETVNKMDIWAFIYNFGGFVGLYFGWSAVSFSNIFDKFSTHSYKMLKIKLIVDIFKKYLK